MLLRIGLGWAHVRPSQKAASHTMLLTPVFRVAGVSALCQGTGSKRVLLHLYIQARPAPAAKH